MLDQARWIEQVCDDYAPALYRTIVMHGDTSRFMRDVSYDVCVRYARTFTQGMLTYTEEGTLEFKKEHLEAVMEFIDGQVGYYCHREITLKRCWNVLYGALVSLEKYIEEVLQ